MCCADVKISVLILGVKIVVIKELIIQIVILRNLELICISINKWINQYWIFSTSGIFCKQLIHATWLIYANIRLIMTNHKVNAQYISYLCNEGYKFIEFIKRKKVYFRKWNLEMMSLLINLQQTLIWCIIHYWSTQTSSLIVLK